MSTPAKIDTSNGFSVIARKAMWRAGRAWAAGTTELTAKQADELGQEKLRAIAADPNFTLASAGAKAVTVASGDGSAIQAHTVVVARKPMWRGGRQWAAGVTALTADQVDELGPEKLATLKKDPNFTVTEAGGTEDTGLDAKTVVELRAYAAEKKIDLGAATKKADIIAAIEAAEALAASAAASKT